MPLKENHHVVKKSSILFFCVCVGGSLNSCISTHLSSCEGLGFPGKEAVVSMCAGVPLRIQTASVVCQRTYRLSHTSPCLGAVQVRVMQTRTR